MLVELPFQAVGGLGVDDVLDDDRLSLLEAALGQLQLDPGRVVLIRW